ncbi:hypothetical protein NMB33_30675 [Burkholderia sp. FXe9]|nr:hypothetical protein NMB33_30675 [Burkholderia sp. FXe9]
MSAIPNVPCAHATIGQPPAGGVPRGTNSAPDTAIGVRPATPSVDA